MTHLTSHYVVTNGVQDAVNRVSRSLHPENIHLSSTITALRLDPSDPSKIEITFETEGGPRIASGFSHIIFATQANSGIPILESYRSSLPLKSLQQRQIDAQIACLRRFKYVRTVVVNHTDELLLPAHPSDRRDLNLVCAEPGATDHSPSSSIHKPDSICVPPNYTMATHIVRGPSSSKDPSRSPVIFQTTNPIFPPRSESILSTAIIERAVLTSDSKLAQRQLMIEDNAPWPWGLSISFAPAPGSSQWFGLSIKRRRVRKLGALQGAGRLQASPDTTPHGVGEAKSIPPGIWHCGSYAHPGIPLLEACVTSALNIVENGIFVVENVDGKAEWVPR